MKTPVGQMSRTAILAAIRDGGFELPPLANPRTVATSVQLAARASRLEWGAERIVSTLSDHLLDRVACARRAADRSAAEVAALELPASLEKRFGVSADSRFRPPHRAH